MSCLAHIRRKFIEAQNDHSKYTAWILHNSVPAERDRFSDNVNAGFKPGATTTISANSSNTSNSNAAFFPKANWEKR